MSDMMAPIPPSEVIDLFLYELRWSYADLARKTGLSRAMISMLMHGKRKVTPYVAGLLGKVLHTTPKYWLNLQSHYDNEMKLAQFVKDHPINK